MQEEILQYEAGYFDGEGMWISPMSRNGLYYQKRGEKRAEWIGSFNDDNAFRLHGDVICVDEVLYFAPMRSQGFNFYDIKQGKFGQIPLLKEKNHFLYAMHIAKYGQCLYWVDRFSDIIIYEYDMTQKEIHIYSTNSVPQKAVLNNVGIGMDMVLDGHRLYLVSTSSNRMIIFDMESHCFQNIEVESCNNGFNTICFDQESFWMSGKKGITRYNIKSQESKDYTVYPDEFGMIYMDADMQIKRRHGFDDSMQEFPFSASVVNGYGVFFFPFRTNMIVYAEKGKERLEGIELQPETEETLKNKKRVTRNRFVGVKGEGNHIVAYSTKCFSLCIFDCDKKVIEKKSPVEAEVYLWNFAKKRAPIITEYEKSGLHDFLRCVAMYRSDYTENDENIGRKTHMEISKIVQGELI